MTTVINNETSSRPFKILFIISKKQPYRYKIVKRFRNNKSPMQKNVFPQTCRLSIPKDSNRQEYK